MKLAQILGTVVAAAAINYAMPNTAEAAIDCTVNEREVTQTITANPTIDDGFAIPIYNSETGKNDFLTLGGSGTLDSIITTWNENEETVGANVFDVKKLTFTDGTSEAEFLEDLGHGRYRVRHCLHNTANSTTSHAVYTIADPEDSTKKITTGIFSSVGMINRIGGEYESNIVLLRATAKWFEALNEGLERSGAELIKNAIEFEYGVRPDRMLPEQLIITLIEMYGQPLAATQLHANETNVDVEGLTIFVEDNDASLCFNQVVTSYKIEGVEMLDEKNTDWCIPNVEKYIGARTESTIYGHKQEGSIADARTLGGQALKDAVTMTCNGDIATVNINYDYEPLNLLTTFVQGQNTTISSNNNISFELPCEDTSVTLESTGNIDGNPLYTRTTTIEPGQVETFNITGVRIGAVTYGNDDGVMSGRAQLDCDEDHELLINVNQSGTYNSSVTNPPPGFSLDGREGSINVPCENLGDYDVDTTITKGDVDRDITILYNVKAPTQAEYDITVNAYVKDDGTTLLATGHPSEQIIKLVWDINNIAIFEGTTEFICEPPGGTAVNTIDEIISNVNLRLSAAQKNDFYGEQASGMEKYTNDADFDGSVCDKDEPDGGYTFIVELALIPK